MQRVYGSLDGGSIEIAVGRWNSKAKKLDDFHATHHRSVEEASAAAVDEAARGLEVYVAVATGTPTAT